MGYMKYIIMAIIAIGALSGLTGAGGLLDFKDKGSINTDAKDIKLTLEQIVESQKTFQKLTGNYANSISAPFTKGLDPTGQGFVTTLDGFADKIHNKDGSQFDPMSSISAYNKETYVLEKGVKIYTAPVFETVTIDNLGNTGTEKSFKVFVDASGYSANLTAVANIETEICSKVKELAGEFRTACKGSTTETITSYDQGHSTLLSLTDKNAQTSDADGLVSASFVSKDKI